MRNQEALNPDYEHIDGIKNALSNYRCLVCGSGDFLIGMDDYYIYGEPRYRKDLPDGDASKVEMIVSPVICQSCGNVLFFTAKGNKTRVVERDG